MSFRNMWDYMKRSNAYVISNPGEQKEYGAEKVFKQIMAKNSAKAKNLQIQEDDETQTG